MSVIKAPTISPASTRDTSRVPRPSINAAPPTSSATAVTGASTWAAGMPRPTNIAVNLPRSPSLPTAPLKNMNPTVTRSNKFGSQLSLLSASVRRRYAAGKRGVAASDSRAIRPPSIPRGYQARTESIFRRRVRVRLRRSLDHHGDAGAVSGRSVDLELPAARGDAVGDIGDPGAVGCGLEPAPGVADREVQCHRAGLIGDGDAGAGAAVLDGVLQRFATAEIESGFDRCGVAAEVLQVESNRDRGVRGDRRQGLRKAPADQRRRIDAVREPADVGDRIVQQSGCLSEQRLICALFSVAGELDEHRQSDEMLLGTGVRVGCGAGR